MFRRRVIFCFWVGLLCSLAAFVLSFYGASYTYIQPTEKNPDSSVKLFIFCVLASKGSIYIEKHAAYVLLSPVPTTHGKPPVDILKSQMDKNGWSFGKEMATFLKQSEFEWWPGIHQRFFYSLVCIPIHWIAVAFGILPLVAACRRRHQHKQDRLGRCRNCGYDLRGSSERCPECGQTIVGAAQEASTRLASSLRN